MTAPELQQRIDAVRWFHRMELAPGLWTPGIKGKGTQDTLDEARLPEDLTGKTVLDVGAWDGFHSFEAERRGASRVLATDHFCWSGPGWGNKDGFDLAHEILRSKVDDLEIDCMDITPERVGGQFDVVLFLGVLYHLKYPMEAIERMAAVTKELLIVETLVDVRAGNRRPIIAFYPGTEAYNDPTNWCGPNPCAVEAMLKVAGFNRVETFCCEPATNIWSARRFVRRTAMRLRMGLSGFGRAVFHAWK